MAKLSKKQAQFCLEYILDLNGTQAAIRAGYSPRTAQEQSSRLLLNVMVKNQIAELVDARNERNKIDADYVLKRLVAIDQMDVIDILTDSGNLKPVSDWPEIWRSTLSGLEIIALAGGEDSEATLKKIRWPDKLKNLELLGRHVDVQAFKDRVEHTGEVGFVERILAARKRARHPETAQLTAQNETDTD
ncbi:terminase small subunit [Citrobacter arsenatis]|uniref:terminase small subunit n=1 Tax=Citrobacter arsenatis TaxID=2546350 RepID=UPI00300E4F7A